MRDLQNGRRVCSWRGALAAAVILLAAWFGYTLWSPGLDVIDGRHDRGCNAIWLGHGWLGADEWFFRYGKQDTIDEFRDLRRVQVLARLLKEHHISDIFPHVAPANPDGRLPVIDRNQTEKFLNAFVGFRVLPWIGGVIGKQVRLEDSNWQQTFVHSAIQLLKQHPRLAGVHVNIEPCPSGNEDFLVLLAELRRAMPEGKILSVAAYPPPTWMHPFPSVHWEENYFRAVSRRVDQMVVMMYDTALPAANPSLSLHLEISI